MIETILVAEPEIRLTAFSGRIGRHGTLGNCGSAPAAGLPASDPLDQ